MRGRAAPPHPRIYRVPPRPGPSYHMFARVADEPMEYFHGSYVTLFVKIPSTIRTAGHLVGEKPCP